MKWIGCLALAALATVSLASAQPSALVSPGPLAASHERAAAACEKCHVPFQGVPARSCLACHPHTARQIEQRSGFHAGVGAQKCATCHPDHKGGEHVAIPALGARFEHRVTGWGLEGKHASVACRACHKRSDTWLGAPTRCVSCHPDTHHEGGLGTDCAACHGPTRWTPRLHHDVAGALSLGGGHAGVACQNCHARGAHLSDKSSCIDCHAPKHGGTRTACESCHPVSTWKAATFAHDFCSCALPGKHQTAPCLSCHVGFRWKPTPFACVACHAKDEPHDKLGACSICHSAVSWKKKVFNHNKPQFRFPLNGKHLELGCENCHKVAGKWSGLGTACTSCHAVPKHGDFGACDTCHGTAGWTPSRFSHDKTRFPLSTPHAKVACQDCHATLARGSFTPGQNTCALCHRDPHDGQFAQANRGAPVVPPAPRRTELDERRAAQPRSCLDCHRADRWTPSTVDVARHQQFRYPLRGAHVEVACARCHAEGRFVGAPTACAGCHVDRHRGRLSSACETCHDERSWKPTQPFDHERQGKLALVARHADLACAACHGVRHDKLAHVRGEVTCATCHPTDRGHGMQFGSACASCHKPTRFSDVPPFDHTGRTDWPLERRHATLKCLTCHDAKRGARLNRACQTCHGDPHRATNGTECGDCHQADRWRLVRYDHDRTEFPLYGRHFTTPCASCHRNPQWYSARTECVACHAKDRPVTADHATRIDCGQCHAPYGWRAINP